MAKPKVEKTTKAKAKRPKAKQAKAPVIPDNGVKLGAIVRVASGGPRMTVVSISGTKCKCTWFAKYHGSWKKEDVVALIASLVLDTAYEEAKLARKYRATQPYPTLPTLETDAQA